MSNDISEMMQNFSQMMNGNTEIPDNIKNILNSMGNNSTSNNNNTNTENSRTHDFNNINTDSNNNNSNNVFENFDMNTFLKLQKIINSMNDKENDSRTNLLISLKPYLKESRKNKVDQYIQLMKMEKIFEIMNPLGGDNKHVQ